MLFVARAIDACVSICAVSRRQNFPRSSSNGFIRVDPPVSVTSTTVRRRRLRRSVDGRLSWCRRAAFFSCGRQRARRIVAKTCSSVVLSKSCSLCRRRDSGPWRWPDGQATRTSLDLRWSRPNAAAAATVRTTMTK